VLPVEDGSRALVHDLVATVSPLDDKEASDQSDILGWVASGAPLFRVQRPAIPPRHLAVYFALLDDVSRSVMLVDARPGASSHPADYRSGQVGVLPRQTPQLLRVAARSLAAVRRACWVSRFPGRPGFASVCWEDRLALRNWRCHASRQCPGG
jgi:hypothetical protein